MSNYKRLTYKANNRVYSKALTEAETLNRLTELEDKIESRELINAKELYETIKRCEINIGKALYQQSIDDDCNTVLMDTIDYIFKEYRDANK